MQGLGETLGYYALNPQAVIFSVASALLYPVLFAEVAALVLACFEAGRFTYEASRRWRARRSLDIVSVASESQTLLSKGDHAAAIGFLAVMTGSPVAQAASASLADGSDLSRRRVLKALADGEIAATRQLERSRIMIRLGPILGLMGTLIPISPALVGLAQGDVQALSDNLVIAFSTTVVGLLIGALGYIVTTFRDRHYQQDVVDIEYVFDRMGV